MPHISLAAEQLWTIGGFPISNALLTTWLVMALLVFLSLATTRRLSLIPSNTQSLVELIVGGLYDFFSSVVGSHIKQFFPLIATLFLYILVANWVGLLPGMGTVGFFHKEASYNHDEVAFTPLFRGATTDLNTTLSLALVAVLGIQYFGFRTLGKHYASRFFDFSNPIMFGVGILELVSDFAKIISFAFRLFGNIFAGEVLLTVMAFLMPFLVPLPFMMMELFVGFVQALVFSMLTAVFLNVAVSHGEGAGKEVSVHG